MAWHRPLSHWQSAFLAGQGPWLWLVQTVAIIAWWHALRHVTWPGATADITPAQSRDWRQTASQPERDDANYAATRITTSHDIHNSGNQSSGFRSPINNISVWLHSLWTSRCLRDRNTLIAQAAVLRAEHEDTDPELHHIMERPGGAGARECFYWSWLEFDWFSPNTGQRWRWVLTW